MADDIRVSPSDTKAQKGQKIYTGEYKGQRIRVSAPAGITKEEDIRPFFEKEFQRREQAKSVVKPVEGSGYPAIDYGTKVIAGLPGAAGRLVSGTGRDPFGEDISGVYNEGIPAPHQPMTAEQMPIAKAIHGQLSPEEGSDLALNMLLMAAGGRFGETQGPTRFRTGLARASQAQGRSGIGRVAGGLAGGTAGVETAKALGIPAYIGAYPGYRVGEAIGSRFPSMVSAFRRGYNEPIPYPVPATGPSTPSRTPTASYYGMPPGIPPGQTTGPYQQPPMQARGIPYGQSPAASPVQTPIQPTQTPQIGPGFSERLQNLKTATTEEPVTPKETPKETPQKSVTLPEVKKFAKASNSSVEEAVKQFEDSGVKVTRGPKIRVRRRK